MTCRGGRCLYVHRAVFFVGLCTLTHGLAYNRSGVARDWGPVPLLIFLLDDDNDDHSDAVCGCDSGCARGRVIAPTAA